MTHELFLAVSGLVMALALLVFWRAWRIEAPQRSDQWPAHGTLVAGGMVAIAAGSLVAAWAAWAGDERLLHLAVAVLHGAQLTALIYLLLLGPAGRSK